MTAGVRRGLDYAVVFVAYVATARFGLSFDALAGIATTVWPPTGIALAALVLRGTQLWPAVSLAAFVVNVTTGIPIWGAAIIADGKHAGGGGGRDPAAAVLVRSAAGTRLRDVSVAGRVGGARQHADQRHIRRRGRCAREAASRRELSGLLGGVVGRRRDGRPADRAADLRVGVADAVVATPAALAGVRAAGRWRSTLVSTMVFRRPSHIACDRVGSRDVRHRCRC